MSGLRCADAYHLDFTLHSCLLALFLQSCLDMNFIIPTYYKILILRFSFQYYAIEANAVFEFTKVC